MKTIEKTIEAKKVVNTGGYVVLRKGSDFRAYWSNPYDDEFEMNEGGDVSEAEILRTHGKTTRYTYHTEMTIDFLSSLIDGWEVWRIYVYHKDMEDPPEGLESIHRLVPQGKNYKALATNGDLLMILPEESAIYLYSICGVRMEYPK